MIISTPDPSSATGATAQRYSDDLALDGFVFSHTSAMSVNPQALDAFEQLVHAIVPSIGPRVYELATLGAAAALGSRHCLLAHARKALTSGALSAQEIVGVMADEGLDPADAAVVRYAAKLSTDSAAMTDADAQELRNAGFSDRQIVDITLAAAARNYFSRTLQALAVPVEDVAGLPPDVRTVLPKPDA